MAMIQVEVVGVVDVIDRAASGVLLNIVHTNSIERESPGILQSIVI